MKKGIGEYRTEHLKWGELSRLESAMKKDGEYYWRNTILLGIFFALRVSDLLAVRWYQVCNGEQILPSFKVWEGKTRKHKKEPRVITLSPLGIETLKDMRDRFNPTGKREYLISPHFDSPGSDQWVNKHLKRIFEKYNVDYGGNVSSHLFRKTFGYRYAELHEFSYESILYLNKIFRHSSLETTMIYLGLENRAVEQAYHEVCQL